MNEIEPPRDLVEYLYRKLSSLHTSARIVFVFDPHGRLTLGHETVIGGRTWEVYHYDGNDLAFRATLARRSLTTPLLIWVTARSGIGATAAHTININGLVDLFTRADDWFDLSLTGVLDELIPGENWPIESVEQYASIFGANLPALIQGHQELRHYLDQGAALDANTLRTLALHVLQPQFAMRELLFHKDTPGQVLTRYIRLIWATNWGENSQTLLCEHALHSPQIDQSVTPWFSIAPEMLASYLYLRHFLGQNHVPHIANSLRGLGILGFDPEPLEPWVDEVLTRWNRDATWREHIITRAEATLKAGDLTRVASLLPDNQSTTLWYALSLAQAPAIFYELARALLANSGIQAYDAIIRQWRSNRPHFLDQLIETPLTPAAEAIAGFLDETSAILNVLATGFNAGSSLADILDWYVQGGFYDLEFACTRAADYARHILDIELAQSLQNYLDELRRRIRTFLQKADEELAQRISTNWSGFLSSPRLATKVISDLAMAKRRHSGINANKRVWIVIFDGMRWDSWQRVVKPRLLERFEFVDKEKAYLSMLPSWTTIARSSLLAGRSPKHWQTPRGQFSTNQKLLAAKLFGIPADEVDQRLQFFAGAEADRTYRQLDPEKRYPWNVLVFNISDDNLHQERGSLTSLNTKISALLDDILHTLDQAVGPEDTLIISSDHGFMELDIEDGIVIKEESRWQREMQGLDNPVRYRYIMGIQHPAGFGFEHTPFQPPKFTVAIGHHWFKRQDDRRAPDRYAHGGLSFAEMVVPGAALKRIIQKRTEIELSDLPEHISIKEGENLVIELSINNIGNQPTVFRLSVLLSSEMKIQEYISNLSPGAHHSIKLQFKPAYQSKTKGKDYILLEYSYQEDSARWTKKHRREIPIEVEERKGVVEFQFAGLDDLDDLI